MSSKPNNEDVDMPDASQPHPSLKRSMQSVDELDAEFPDRPKNEKPSLPFHHLITHVFDPINEVRQKPRGPAARSRAHIGPHGPIKRSPQEESRLILERFIAEWRDNVGPDLYPTFRLLLPDKDQDRPMYGLKEKTIGRLLVKTMGIGIDSQDGQALSNWKVPGNSVAARMAGDFAGRCFEVINKRPLRTQMGNLTVDDVNELLDKLSLADKEKEQQPVFNRLYAEMSPKELMWVIRMILRQPLKFGSSHETIFRIFHPDAVPLYNVSSSLRKVCWTLYDPNTRLDASDTSIVPMQCFQPQLAQFQPSKATTFAKMVAGLQATEEDPEFWIEEKLDGERLQMHMVTDSSVKGGKAFGFWSRKAKEYTHLYGNSYHDDKASLTRFLQGALDEGVKSVVLDGEMITWDPNEDAMVGFGTLKTAAIDQAKNPYSKDGWRPLYRIFDLLYLNGRSLTSYTLRDRRRALDRIIKNDPANDVRGVYRRFEVHKFKVATSPDEIEPALRRVIEDASEGLVLKNPRSPYRLNERNDDWLKVKPEYMEEFGEQLDCIVIGGYYGSGKRGGTMSSFLCGLLANRDSQQPSASQGKPKSSNPQLAYSFFKVGGGFKAEDYAIIRHRTEGKWTVYDPKEPPKDWIELGGGDLQYERPDEWIKPEDSVVLQVKAADTRGSDQFRTRTTLRFPRFVKLRTDKDWTTTLSINEFLELKSRVLLERSEKQEQKLRVDDSRRKRLKRDVNTIKVAGGSIDDVKTPYAGPETKILQGLTFFVMTESVSPARKKPEIEQFVKANGGALVQTHDAVPNTICIADKRSVKVAAIQKRGDFNIIRPKWLFHCIAQSEADKGKPTFLIPLEPEHMFFTKEDEVEGIKENVDEDGDSFSRDTDADELRHLFGKMATPALGKAGEAGDAKGAFRQQLEDHGHGLGALRGWLFEGLTLYFDHDPHSGLAADEGGHVSTIAAVQLETARMTARFAAASVTTDLSRSDITHVISASGGEDLKGLRKRLAAARRTQPRIVSPDWVLQSWDEETQLAEERFEMR